MPGFAGFGHYSPAFDPVRFEELVLYFAAQSEHDQDFGDTKLNKLLAFSDMLAYANFGRPLTGAEYQRQPHGPLARPCSPSAGGCRSAGMSTPLPVFVSPLR